MSNNLRGGLVVRDSILGFIIGDVMGVPTEFMLREKLQNNKVLDMIGNASHNVEKGSWSDDSSMVIATIESVINCNGIDYEYIMGEFNLWVSYGKYTPQSKVYGIGRTTLKALNNYKKGSKPLESGLYSFNDNGNGSLMRILPISLFCYYSKLDNGEIYDLIKNISSLTHSHEISIMGCLIYTNYVIELLKGKSKQEAYMNIRIYDYSYFTAETKEMYKRLLKADISKLELNDIKSTGFVVDTLEACLWCLLRHNNYKNTIIEAINLGNDTDTISALSGGLAGIIYGINDIPTNWINNLINNSYILDVCSRYEEYLLSERK